MWLLMVSDPVEEAWSLETDAGGTRWNLLHGPIHPLLHPGFGHTAYALALAHAHGGCRRWLPAGQLALAGWTPARILSEMQSFLLHFPYLSR